MPHSGNKAMFGPAEWPADRARRLRKNMTLPEVLLWEALRDRRLGGYKFRRQQPRGTYVADFYCAQAKLVIEVDGAVHALKRDSDAERDAWMRSRGLEVLRVSAKSVLRDLPGVLGLIRREVERRAMEKE